MIPTAASGTFVSVDGALTPDLKRSRDVTKQIQFSLVALAKLCDGFLVLRAHFAEYLIHALEDVNRLH